MFLFLKIDMSTSSSSSLTTSQSSSKQPLAQSTNKPEQTATSPRKSVTIDEMYNELKLLDK